MNAPKCPECATERDAEFQRADDGSAVGIECFACEKVWPCCPGCGTLKIRRNGSDLMRCGICSSRFTEPTLKRPERAFSDEEVAFLSALA
ncbi:MAG: hypothetical protein V3T83_08970, partial [Acidobacteriota bacterium]